MNKLQKILVLIIIILNLAIRVIGLNKSPPSVNFDEAALGYNAYSILKTGKDEYGNWLPLSLRSFNDYKPALYAYLSIPFIAIMGLNEISIRMVSALAGVVSAGVLFLFLNKFIKNKWLAIVIFLFLSMEPWRIHFSRVALETNLSQMWFVLGAYFLFKFIENKNKIKIGIISALFFVLSAYSYHSARAAVPALLVLVAMDPLQWFWTNNLKNIKKILLENKNVLIILLTFIILIIPVFLSGQSKLVMTRFNQENVFKRYYRYSPVELLNKNNLYLSILNNSYYYAGAILSGHVMAYFSPINFGGRVYHWVRGSVQYIPGFSVLGWMETLFFVIGLVVIAGKIKLNFKYRFLFYWIIAAGAPAALTWNWFHPLRSMNMYVAIEIIVAMGAVMVLSKIFVYKNIFIKNGIVGGLFLIMILNTVFVVVNEYRYSAFENHGEYQPGGFKEGVPVLAKLANNYEKIYVDSPHAQAYIFFLFYQSYAPEKIQKYANVRPAPGVEGNLNFNFDKYIFKKYSWLDQRNESKIAIWTSSEVKEEEINSTNGANLIWVQNAITKKAAAIITKE